MSGDRACPYEGPAAHDRARVGARGDRRRMLERDPPRRVIHHAAGAGITAGRYVAVDGERPLPDRPPHVVGGEPAGGVATALVSRRFGVPVICPTSSSNAYAPGASTRAHGESRSSSRTALHVRDVHRPLCRLSFGAYAPPVQASLAVGRITRSLGSVALVAALMSAASPARATSLPPVNGAFTGVASVSRTDAWAVGWRFDTDIEGGATLTEHWDGSNWRIVPSPNPDWSQRLIDVAAVSSNDVWAVGEAGYGGLTEHWNGADWSIVPIAAPSTHYLSWVRLESVAAIGPNDVWAVGAYELAFAVRPLIEHWDGTTWSVVHPARLPRTTDEF